MSSIPIDSPVTRSPARLTPRQLNQLRTELERERRWLTGTAALDWGAERNESESPRSAGSSRSHPRLLAVLEALDRIAAGTYGVCTRCRSPIPFGRLEVIPETGTCVRCGLT